jgi:formylglycine-generating enzyme required for sulfatase activity
MKIGEVKHSKLKEYKKQVKIDALKAAKEKATYLLASIDEELGRVLTIDEGSSSSMFGGFYLDNVAVTNNEYRQFMDDVVSEKFKTIKLTYEMSAVFEIK